MENIVLFPLRNNRAWDRSKVFSRIQKFLNFQPSETDYSAKWIEYTINSFEIYDDRIKHDPSNLDDRKNLIGLHWTLISIRSLYL